MAVIHELIHPNISKFLNPPMLDYICRRNIYFVIFISLVFQGYFINHHTVFLEHVPIIRAIASLGIFPRLSTMKARSHIGICPLLPSTGMEKTSMMDTFKRSSVDLQKGFELLSPQFLGVNR